MSPANRKSDFYPLIKERFIELVLPDQPETRLSYVLLRLALWLAIFLYTINLFGAIHLGAINLLHLVNLPFHEAGHVIFGIFGNQFLHSLGGMLGQLIMPIVCASVLLIQQRDAFGASIAMWWFAENFIDLAPYIQDASIGKLPLLGGNTGRTSPYGVHDFEYLLTETGLINYDQTLAVLCYSLGYILMLLSLAWGALVLWQQYKSYQFFK